MDEREISNKDRGTCNHGNVPATCPQCREARERSWQDLASVREIMEKATTPETMTRVEKLEIKDEAERAKMAKKIFNFLSREFGRNEVNSVATNDTIMREGISNTYAVEDKRGNLQAYLLSHNVEIPGREPGEQSKTMFLTWYITTHPNHRGEHLSQALYAKALAEFEQKLRTEGKEFWGMAEEAEANVEGLFNRFHGSRRLYMETDKGIEDVPYLAPPEDESGEGVPEHFMVRLANGRNEMTTEELRQVFETVHAQYSDPRFFTVQHLKADADDADYGIDRDQVDEEFARNYRVNYQGIVKRASDKMLPILERAKNQRVFFMSAVEREQARKLGKNIIEIEVEE